MTQEDREGDVTTPAATPAPSDADRTERPARRSDAERYVAALRALEEVARAPGQTSLLMEICVDRAMEMVGATGASIAVLQEGELFYATTTGDLRGRLAGSQAVSHTFGGLAVTTGQTVHSRDARSDPRVAKDIVQPLGIRSAIATPLVQARRRMGLLWVSSDRPNAFDEVDVELMSRLGGVASARLDYALVREERRSSERALVDSRLQQAAMLTALDEGVMALDTSRRVLLVNAAAERILGVSRERLLASDALGMPWQAVNEDGTPWDAEDQPAAATLRTKRTLRGSVMGIHRPDGTLRWISVSTVPVFDASGDVLRGVVACFTDVTEQRRARVGAVPPLRLLRHVERLCQVGTWTWCPGSRYAHRSAGMRAVLGAAGDGEAAGQEHDKHGDREDDQEDLVSLRGYLDLVHPDDRATVRRAVFTALRRGGDHSVEHRIVRRDGRQRRLCCSVEVRLGADGRAAQMWGSVRDVTATAG